RRSRSARARCTPSSCSSPPTAPPRPPRSTTSCGTAARSCATSRARATGRPARSTSIRRVDLDLRRLRYFVEVADQLSFVRAALRLHITQPALSRQIANLEASLGVTLFERSRTGTSLSREGALLLERARALLGSASDFERE